MNNERTHPKSERDVIFTGLGQHTHELLKGVEGFSVVELERHLVDIDEV